ncbi:hypothetical protein ACFQ7F_00725 [Streptomyces sp. NPDC056486]|uniref:hypothetical protein n=1 Tax=Streptomyces sp. NPDC056486 TaxID=3345835 RepID=UPI00368AEB33
MIEDVLRAEAQVLHDMVSTHDTEDFIRRLKQRIEDTPPRTARVQSSYRLAPVPARNAPPTQNGATPPTRPPATPRLRRRRPTPIMPSDPHVQGSAVLDYVRRLCTTLLRASDFTALIAAFDQTYDAAGARTFACLQYTRSRNETALYWWRFAAGGGDPLAAHLLAAHHSAHGSLSDARSWHAFSRYLGYNPIRHLPTPLALKAESPPRRHHHCVPSRSPTRTCSSSISKTGSPATSSNTDHR